MRSTVQELYYRRKQSNNSHYRKELKRNPTKAEVIVLEWLKYNNIRYIFQKGFLLPFHRIVDFYIPSKKTIIEIDGSAHYTTKDKDQLKDSTAFMERKFKTIRLTNDQVFNREFVSILRATLF